MFLKERVTTSNRITCLQFIFKQCVDQSSLMQLLMNKNPDDKSYNLALVEYFIRRMNIMYISPETKLCVQDDISNNHEDDCLYFIAKGDAQSFVQDRFDGRTQTKVIKVLTVGDHFGEIAMQFNCKRTVSVSSISYVTCSTINKKNFKEIITLYPEAHIHLMKQIMSYQDPLKIFMEIHLNKIKYFKDLPKHIKCDILFNMKCVSFEKGDYLYKIGDYPNTMYLI